MIEAIQLASYHQSPDEMARSFDRGLLVISPEALGLSFNDYIAELNGIYDRCLDESQVASYEEKYVDHHDIDFADRVPAPLGFRPESDQDAIRMDIIGLEIGQIIEPFTRRKVVSVSDHQFLTYPHEKSGIGPHRDHSSSNGLRVAMPIFGESRFSSANYTRVLSYPVAGLEHLRARQIFRILSSDLIIQNPGKAVEHEVFTDTVGRVTAIWNFRTYPGV